MIYLMSDIHGDCRNFLKLVKKSGITDQDRLIIDGDVIDRGPENLAMLDYCMSHENVTLILGNHEMFMRMYLDNPAFRADWYRFGGNTTLSELDRVSTDRMLKYYNFLRELPLYAEIASDGIDYIVTHTGYYADGDIVYSGNGIIDVRKSIDRTAKKDLYNLMISTDLYTAPASVRFDKFIIAGHTPVIFERVFGEEACPDILHRSRYIDLDCGSGWRDKGGRLGCLRLDDGKEWYI